LAEVSEEDIERLASRLAMMVSEEGEAANAGRAVAQLARRLGLTGGELKEMFLHGATGGAFRPLPRPPARDDMERLERELATLRKGLRLMEASHRELSYERDALQAELEMLRNRAEVTQSNSQLRAVVIGVVLLALAGAGSVGVLMSLADAPPPAPMAVVPPPSAAPVPGAAPALAPHPATPDYGPVMRRVAVVRTGRAVAYRRPDRTTAAVATLQSGMPVVVRRVFYNQQGQWAEVEVGSTLGYVLTSDIDLS
jgi:hypothetical protein